MITGTSIDISILITYEMLRLLKSKRCYHAMTVAEDISFTNALIAMIFGKLVTDVGVDYVPNVGNIILINGQQISVKQCSMFHIDILFLVVHQQFGMFFCINEIFGKS
jgi:hypothetical protein